MDFELTEADHVVYQVVSHGDNPSSRLDVDLVTRLHVPVGNDRYLSEHDRSLSQ